MPHFYWANQILILTWTMYICNLYVYSLYYHCYIEDHSPFYNIIESANELLKNIKWCLIMLWNTYCIWSDYPSSEQVSCNFNSFPFVCFFLTLCFSTFLPFSSHPLSRFILIPILFVYIRGVIGIECESLHLIWNNKLTDVFNSL